jgi:membrane associated rhomboid family serine protease
MSPSRLQWPSFRSTSAALAVGIIVCSVVSILLLKTAGIALFLVGQSVWQGALWMPLTWLLVETSPQGILFSALALWSVGGSLERQWGRVGFLRYVLGVTFVSGLLTVAASRLSMSVSQIPHGGGGVVALTAWVAYGLLIGSRQTNFFGFPVSGFVLAGIGGGMTLLNALFYGWQLVFPNLIALALMLLMYRFGTPGDWWLRFQSARLSRDLKKRSRHLSSLGEDGEQSRGSDRYWQ